MTDVANIVLPSIHRVYILALIRTKRIWKISERLTRGPRFLNKRV